MVDSTLGTVITVPATGIKQISQRAAAPAKVSVTRENFLPPPNLDCSREKTKLPKQA